MGLNTHRYLSVDFIRGIALILMVIFHFCFDLNNFQYISINISTGMFWMVFRYLIITIFLLCAGVSLYLAYEHGVDYIKVAKRVLRLVLASIAITSCTYFIFPNSWIYFGILHFITTASILGVFFVRMPFIAFIVGFFILIGWSVDILTMHWLFELLKNPLSLPLNSEDLISFTPWFGVVLIGVFLGEKEIFVFDLIETRVVKTIALFGRHSLLIYLIHQPILFSFLYLLSK